MESRTIRYGMTGFTALLLAFSSSACSKEPSQPQEAHDPGVRRGAAGAGDSYPGLSDPLKKLFDAGRKAFGEPEEVKDGLGPRMNMDSCLSCHANPDVGGSSPEINPQFLFYKDKLDHKTNTLPSFITEKGPTREARFKFSDPPNNTIHDGGVHGLFTIAGMTDAKSCKIDQPKFAEQLGLDNVIFRIPTPVFGAGLIEQIPDTAIKENIAKEADREQKNTYRIKGKFNFVMAGSTITGLLNNNGNDGTIARFGWKAQNKSLLLFAGEAYNVEMGISNELFQTEREEDANCQFKPTPNDMTADPDRIPEKDADEFTKKLAILSDMEKFAFYMRLLAPPEPSSNVPGGFDSIARGKTSFSEVGCALCHAPMLKTGKSKIAQLSEKEAHLYSDLAVHQMGPNLDDGVSQGQAKGNEFRTAPLWGLGQRIFFLHDGRTSDLVKAIEEHRGGYDANASEANYSVEQYNKLGERDKQDLLNFLRSL